MRLSFGHITWVHIHAMSKEDFLNKTVWSKARFEQKGMLHQDYQTFGSKQNCHDIAVIGKHYRMKMFSLWLPNILHIYLIVSYIADSDIMYLSDFGQLSCPSCKVTWVILSTHIPHTVRSKEPFHSCSTFFIYLPFNFQPSIQDPPTSYLTEICILYSSLSCPIIKFSL